MQLCSTSRAWLMMPIVLCSTLAGACNLSAEHAPATPQATAAPATPPIFPAMTTPMPASGAERFGEDPHPEQVDLSQVTKESLAQGIASYVQDEAKRHGGVFTIDDRRRCLHAAPEHRRLRANRGGRPQAGWERPLRVGGAERDLGAGRCSHPVSRTRNCAVRRRPFKPLSPGRGRRPRPDRAIKRELAAGFSLRCLRDSPG